MPILTTKGRQAHGPVPALPDPPRPLRQGPSARRFVSLRLCPPLRYEVRDLQVRVGSLAEIRRDLPLQQGAKRRPERDLKVRRRRRVLPQHIPDRSLAIELTNRTSRDGSAHAA